MHVTLRHLSTGRELRAAIALKMYVSRRDSHDIRPLQASLVPSGTYSSLQPPHLTSADSRFFSERDTNNCYSRVVICETVVQSPVECTREKRNCAKQQQVARLWQRDRATRRDFEGGGSRLNYRFNGYVSRQYLWTVR